jgi:hypothetical protein
MLSRDSFTQVKVPQETVEVPELGGSVIVRGLTARGRDELDASLMRGKGRKRTVDMQDFRAKLVCRCVVDEEGKRIFSDDDLPMLGELPASVLCPLFDVAHRLSGYATDEEADDEG